MNAQDYHQQFTQRVSQLAVIVKSDIEFREIDENECYIKGILTFVSGHKLHLAEYVILESDSIRRAKYRYQLLDPNGNHIARWDNAPHHRDVETFPHHRHNSKERTHSSQIMSPANAIAESLALIEKSDR